MLAFLTWLIYVSLHGLLVLLRALRPRPRVSVFPCSCLPSNSCHFLLHPFLESDTVRCVLYTVYWQLKPLLPVPHVKVPTFRFHQLNILKTVNEKH